MIVFYLIPSGEKFNFNMKLLFEEFINWKDSISSNDQETQAQACQENGKIDVDFQLNNNGLGHEALQVLNIENGDEEIYPGALITKSQSVLLLVAFLLKNNLTDAALTDLLDILSLILPSTFPSSKYKFYKAIQVEESQAHFYCESCLSYIGTSAESTKCDECDTPFNRENSMKNGTFFLHIPLKEQLKQLLSDPILYEYLTNRNLEVLTESTVISDVTTGKLYKSLIRDKAMAKNDISLTWNADGIPVFKSSQYSIWPIQCMINELPPHLRSKNILLTGLWFGATKPQMNTFLEAFVNECHDLEKKGFLLREEIIPRKVFALVCSSDSPARAMLRNCKQFNGKYGCDWCEHEGVSVLRNRGPQLVTIHSVVIKAQERHRIKQNMLSKLK
ncbi:uncharacterized protein LOC124436007 [Xenia sp. Carnegie-2017]|uniref:uncharacterized protein LOC124436007 n=1 Tax=Xenia sp. Carnegie-2017 TaxID=2897299 RepID=UPI001F0349E6|nr:uncharacterized protein LOC124436007 [Xenia sp. Carnegie-2017]